MKYRILSILAILTLLVSCEQNGRTDVPDTKDHEVVVSIAMPGKAAYAPPLDPGTDHGEWTENWDQMAVFFLYSDRNYVSVSVISKTEFDKITADASDADGVSRRHVTVPVLTGTVSEVRIAAFAEPQTLSPSIFTMTRAEVENFATVSLNEGTLFNENITRTEYLRSLLTGTQTLATPIALTAADKDAATPKHIIDITLNRLVAKVDLQYDLQPAYDGGIIYNPTMSAITLCGLDKGYFFETPTYSDNTALPYEQTITSNISDRNGRVYFYTLPGVKNQLTFNVVYDGNQDGKQFTATFKTPLTSDSWHKVNLRVSGTTFSTTNGQITLGEEP